MIGRELQIQIASLLELPAAAESIVALCKGGGTIGFSGSLGAGKTTLIRELVRLLGSDEEVASPTFALSHQYRTKTGLVIAHWDLYRLRSGALPELFEPPSSHELRLIEWIEREPTLPHEIEVRLEIVEEADGVPSERRVLTVTEVGGRSA